MTAPFDVVSYLAGKGRHGRKANGPEVTYACFFDCQEPDDSRKRKLYVNADEGFYSCKVCGAEGGTTLLQRHFGDEVGNATVAADSHVKRQILSWATEVGAAMLANNDDQLLYLLDRGLSPETILEAKLGWVGNGWSLTGSLPEQYDAKQLAETGLVYRDGPRAGRDFFHDHLLIPYLSHGKTLQLRGRQSGGATGGAKYLTGPGEPVRLYGVDSLEGATDVIITEGEMDCLAVQQSLRGSPEDKVRRIGVVGLAGANGFKEGFESYLSEAKRIFLLLDPDDTGRREAAKIKERLGARARILELPAELPKCDATEYLLPVPPDATQTWRSAHPHAGHGWSDLVALFGRASGKRIFSIGETGSSWRKQRTVRRGLVTGYSQLDAVLHPGGLPGQLMVILSKTGGGKGHPLDTEVPTPEGFRRWGDLRVGDQVFGSDGQPTEVAAVYDRGQLDAFAVRFSDGTSTVVDGDHLWAVRYRGGDRRQWLNKTLSTTELLGDTLKDYSGRAWKYTIPMASPVAYPEAELPIDPYALGALVANGSLGGTSAILTTPDTHVPARLRGAGLDLHALNRGDACPAYVVRGAIGKVRALGLAVLSGEKFLPAVYLTASVRQRVALLQGLMDGDGSSRGNEGRQQVSYHTSSRQLAVDVVELVNSLGGTGRILTTSRDKNEHTVGIMLPTEVSPFTPGSRKDRPADGHRYRTGPWRAIVDITRLGPVSIRCIAVTAPDSLYLIGRGYHVTHNTILLCNLAYNMRAHRHLIFSLEMTREEVYERLQRIYRFWHPLASDDEVERGLTNIWICDENRLSDRDFVDILAEYTAEVGASPEVVHVDYLGYFARGQKGNSQYEKVANAVMQLKAMAKGEDPASRFFLISPSQVNRLAKEGKPIDLDDARDAGQVEETADFLLSIWRPDDALSATGQAQPSGNVNISVLKSRHGGKGTTLPLTMDMLTLAIVDKHSPAAKLAMEHNHLAWRGTTYDELRVEQLRPVQLPLRRDLV